MGNSHGKPVVYTDEVNLNHFRLLTVVGKGAFGKVRIVERKDSGLTFALKYIRKDKVVWSESVRNIIRERPVVTYGSTSLAKPLQKIVCDFGWPSWQMSGGDLRFHISRKTFTEDCVRFWMAELACALRYIHQQGIVHRDVKPDNVLLDSEGHVHLADFNVASDFRPPKLLTSKSGTLAYLAPEVLRGPGYLDEVDWWSLGVTFYECIYGARPFEGKTHDELVENICAANPKFHVTRPPVTMPCIHVMAALLEKDKRKRIKAAGWEAFTSHPFFDPLNFELLESKLVPPIFIPSSDRTHFDATYDLEELLFEKAPLEARARKQKPRAELRQNATTREIREDELHRMIETMFEPFDYIMASYEATAAAALATDGTVEALDTTRSTPSQLPSKAHSQTTTPDGTPPISPSQSPSHGQQKEFSSMEELKSQLPPSAQAGRPQSAVHSQSFSGPRPQSAARQASKCGGVQMVLDEHDRWSSLADRTTTLPVDAAAGREGKESGSVLGFLRGKKTRERNPKPKEAGVLGKAGARHIIG
ncbi:Serine/threonine kinase [Neophaeococcomyces mojaviensis]|uniref:Serine/threonine kinase n=1 Tax=Neophaeococcomyces mojaviensis TaxID=3383035 RepID=A0ACC2ZUP2_9EURO|nr:Serine/threonine kinase [Knufia sp. JES_112]